MWVASKDRSPADTAAADTDAKLVARAAAGEAAAFEVIMRRHNRLLFRSARSVVGDDAEAQDVVQEAYLRAFSRLDTFRGDAALGTWLARIAINVALDVQRKRGRAVPLADEPISTSEPAGEHAMAFSTPVTESPQMLAERSEVRDLLQRAIEGLPPIYRSVFVLRAVEEMSVDETAFCLQVSDSVVKTRYLRARSMLRDALAAKVEAHTLEVFEFAGTRCDALVSQVLAELQRQGRIRPVGNR